jgi:hypothetical protein
MNYVVKILTPASDEAVEAALWYDAQCPGMGAQFLEEVDAAARKLALNPEIHSVRFADVRRAPLRRFKFYGLYCLIRERESGSFQFFTGGVIRAGCGRGGNTVGEGETANTKGVGSRLEHFHQICSGELALHEQRSFWFLASFRLNYK